MLASITAERDQLKMDLQENVEMVGYSAFAPPPPSHYQLCFSFSFDCHL